MKIAIDSDHAGFRYKEKIKELLQSLGHQVTDLGTHSEEPMDYPLYIRPAAESRRARRIRARGRARRLRER
ncbi:MAG TPA: RpiB/LacA/LacB family sugar-phosphate isomerase [Candidatus Sulfopaludibacter sp.]|nr:RpiB/LacA/LacB family sugar-phosphate isomerase [Candidatus Sulfopaludibacter sp.]